MFGWLQDEYQFTARVADDQPEPGFSGAQVVKLVVNNAESEATGDLAAEFCLRRWPRESLPVARILGLHALLRHVSAAGVSQVAVPLAGRNGLSLVRHQRSLWQVEPWMPGTANFHSQPDSGRLTAAFHCLAEWHLAAESFVAPPEARYWFSSRRAAIPSAVSERLERFHALRNGGLAYIQAGLHVAAHAHPFRELAQQFYECYHRSSPAVVRRLTSAAQQVVPVQPCLRDVWHDHVLFSGNRVTGLIDASASRTENVASDLSRLLGSMVEDDLERRDCALRAYRAVRPLSSIELDLVRILDESGVLLSGMTWLQRMFVDGHLPQNPARIRDRLQTFTRRAERIGL